MAHMDKWRDDFIKYMDNLPSVSREDPAFDIDFRDTCTLYTADGRVVELAGKDKTYIPQKGEKIVSRTSIGEFTYTCE